MQTKTQIADSLSATLGIIKKKWQERHSLKDLEPHTFSSFFIKTLEFLSTDSNRPIESKTVIIKFLKESFKSLSEKHISINNEFGENYLFLPEFYQIYTMIRKETSAQFFFDILDSKNAALKNQAREYVENLNKPIGKNPFSDTYYLNQEHRIFNKIFRKKKSSQLHIPEEVILNFILGYGWTMFCDTSKIHISSQNPKELTLTYFYILFYVCIRIKHKIFREMICHFAATKYFIHEFTDLTSLPKKILLVRALAYYFNISQLDTLWNKCSLGILYKPYKSYHRSDKKNNSSAHEDFCPDLISLIILEELTSIGIIDFLEKKHQLRKDDIFFSLKKLQAILNIFEIQFEGKIFPSIPLFKTLQLIFYISKMYKKSYTRFYILGYLNLFFFCLKIFSPSMALELTIRLSQNRFLEKLVKDLNSKDASRIEKLELPYAVLAFKICFELQYLLINRYQKLSNSIKFIKSLQERSSMVLSPPIFPYPILNDFGNCTMCINFIVHILTVYNFKLTKLLNNSPYIAKYNSNNNILLSPEDDISFKEKIAYKLKKLPKEAYFKIFMQSARFFLASEVQNNLSICITNFKSYFDKKLEPFFNILQTYLQDNNSFKIDTIDFYEFILTIYYITKFYNEEIDNKDRFLRKEEYIEYFRNFFQITEQLFTNIIDNLNKESANYLQIFEKEIKKSDFYSEKGPIEIITIVNKCFLNPFGLEAIPELEGNIYTSQDIGKKILRSLLKKCAFKYDNKLNPHLRKYYPNMKRGKKPPPPSFFKAITKAITYKDSKAQLNNKLATN